MVNKVVTKFYVTKSGLYLNIETGLCSVNPAEATEFSSYALALTAAKALGLSEGNVTLEDYEESK